ncbi:histidine phosphatase family protein [Butyrivibrio sp. MC2013]|uniref:histidine phosphatase family protein n=1 Tax=Butyrivibrio sp. MC2013 TaxID=1280686 RepID=UPI000422444E|nr:histidine phosphatase family protein [Butyrivibrio sp. MC2013]
MYLYLVRHGETSWNKEKLFQGGTDIALNDEGRAQAKAASERLLKAGIVFDKVISSPLGRAVETALVLSGKSDKEIMIDERIREMSFGSLEGTDYYAVKDNNALLFNEPLTYVPQCGEETYDNLYGRVRSFLEDIKELENKADKVLVSTHGACMRALLTVLRDTDPNLMWKISVGNCQFFKFRLEKGLYLEEDASDINTEIRNGNV